MGPHPSSRKSNYGDDKRIGGGGRVGGASERKKSTSPGAHMRKQGEEFLRRIEELK